MKISRNGNAVTIDAPEAIYTIIYGMHVRGQNIEEIPEDLDGLFLETGTFAWYENPLKCVEELKQHVQYKPVFRMLEKNKIPVIFADLKYKLNDMFLIAADNFLAAVQWVAGVRMFSNLVYRNKEQKKKRSAADYIARAIVAGWLVLPFAANILRLGSTIFNVGQDETARLKRFSHKAHPETDILYLNIRNAVIAEKLKYLAEHMGKRPHIGIILGAGHVGIEDMFSLTSGKRLQFLTKWLNLLKKVAKEKYMYAITEVAFTGKVWGATRTLEVDSLRQLAA